MTSLSGIQAPSRSAEFGRSQSLAQGASNQEFNREEFVDLKARADQISFLESAGTQDGKLADLRTGYNETYQLYRHGDYHPATENAQDGTLTGAGKHLSGKVFDALQDKRIQVGQAASALDGQSRVFGMVGGYAGKEGGNITPQLEQSGMTALRNSLANKF